MMKDSISWIDPVKNELSKELRHRNYGQYDELTWHVSHAYLKLLAPRFKNRNVNREEELN